MLCFVTLFACLQFASSQHMNTYDPSASKYVPSAHLEGGEPWPRFYATDEVITAWNRNDSKSHLMDGFGYAEGRLHVPTDGRYYVYAQMYFCSRTRKSNNRVAVYADNRILLMIHKDMAAGQQNTGFAAGVFLLTAGETIYVKVIGWSLNTKIWLGPNHCFFGAYLI